MKKRPDAESFLITYHRLCVILGLLGIVVGFLVGIFEINPVVVGILIMIGFSLLLFSIAISICMRFHNVFLDIRDAEFEIVRSLRAIQISNSYVNEPRCAENDIGNIETVLPEDNEELQVWKDSQILHAKAALDAGKISEKIYIDYVNKVSACKRIPNNNSKK